MKRRHILSFSVITVLGLVPVATWAQPGVISDYVLLAASAGLPGIDIQKTCRECYIWQFNRCYFRKLHEAGAG
jgi:hypothetical protein